MKISAINISSERGTVKKRVQTAIINKDGIAGDAHAGPWHRQVTIISREAIDQFSREMNYNTQPEEIAVNVVIDNLDVEHVALLDTIKLNDAVLQVTQIGKKPHHYDSPVLQATGTNVMFEKGLFCRVISEGKIEIGHLAEHIRRPLKIKVLTLSDRVSKGVYADLSGPKIKEILDQFFQDKRWHPQIDIDVIPDDTSILETVLHQTKTENTDLLFTTGGTGVGPRDITPDVVTAFCDKMIPGIMDHIRLKYGSDKPNALLSRSVAGVAGNTIVYTLPGSVKAVTEYMQEILHTMEHLILMLHGIGH